jgi:hypothetical protein
LLGIPVDIERTMQFIVERLAALTAREEKWREEAEERWKRTEERQSELEAEYTERILAAEERHDREMASIRAELRRGIRLSVEEHRRERVRRHALEGEMRQRHLEHEEGIKELRKSMQKWLERGGNGHQASS